MNEHEETGYKPSLKTVRHFERVIAGYEEEWDQPDVDRRCLAWHLDHLYACLRAEQLAIRWPATLTPERVVEQVKQNAVWLAERRARSARLEAAGG